MVMTRNPTREEWKQRQEEYKEVLDQIRSIDSVAIGEALSFRYYAPERFKEYAKNGLRVRDERGDYAGLHFFEHAPKILHTRPELYEDFTRVMLHMKRDRDSAWTISGLWMDIFIPGDDLLYSRYEKEYLTVLRDVVARLVKKDAETVVEFLGWIHKPLSEKRLNLPRAPDLLLIDYIHDPKSAHVVGQVIDKQRYRKQYAKKCQWFYGCRGSAGALPRLE